MTIIEKFPKIHESWKKDFQEIYEKHKLEFDNLFKLLISIKKQGYNFFPSVENIFKAFETDKEKIKVLILGEEPYHLLGFATGLAFAIPEDSKFIPKSLDNIWDEVSVRGANDILYGNLPIHKTLEHWVDQGVLLLNVALTVQEKLPGSHLNEWRFFTQEIINRLNEDIILCAWGQAQNFNFKQKNVLKAPHPMTGNKGFHGCGHFKTINQLLIEELETKINW